MCAFTVLPSAERSIAAGCVRWSTVTVTDNNGNAVRKTVCAQFENEPGDSSPGIQPIAAPGGGSGGHSRCTSTPYGPIAEVRAIWDALNHQRDPDLSGPGPGSDPVTDLGIIGVGAWYRMTSATIEILYHIRISN